MGSAPYVVPALINGKDEYLKETFSVVSPRTGEVCWEAASATPEDAIRAAEAAQAAFPAWSSMKPFARQAILFKAADIMEQRADELVTYMHTEMGTDQPTAKGLVVGLSIQYVRDIACRIVDISGTAPTLQADGQSGMVWKEPYGVTLGIVPWNAPYVFATRSAATAIAAGNTTILKGSDLSPRCFYAVAKAFLDAGVPPGVINVLNCKPQDAASVVNTLIANPIIKKVDFTGSAAIGRKVASQAGLHLKPTLMELGGKNSAIILPDADLAKAAQWCLIGAFANAGQICMCTDMILIHKDIAKEFLETLKQTLAGMQAQTPELPVVVTQASVARVKAIIDDAIKHGGELFSGGAPPAGSKTPQVIPTVIGGVSKEMEFWQEEAFGPLVGYRIINDEDEAVELANSPGYGLAAAVYTRDLRKGLALAKRIQSGAVHINTMTINTEIPMPFGGVRNSGWGRFNAKEGMEEFLVTKSVTWDD